MNIKEYRGSKKMTQTQLAGELNSALGTNYSKPHISMMERGIMVTPKNVEQYINSTIDEKVVITSADALKGDRWTITPHSEIKSLKSAKTTKSALAEEVLNEIKYYTKDNPFIAKDFAESLGIKEVGVRMAIRELRLNHIRICSGPGQRGYWLEENGGGYEATRQQMLSRAFRIFEVVKAMDENKDGQYQWVERG